MVDILYSTNIPASQDYHCCNCGKKFVGDIAWMRDEGVCYHFDGGEDGMQLLCSYCDICAPLLGLIW